jgi:NADH dehydrogenase FAD-containing subunit
MGNRTTPFLYKAPGQLASIGRRTGIARIFGLKISGVVGMGAVADCLPDELAEA